MSTYYTYSWDGWVPAIRKPIQRHKYKVGEVVRIVPTLKIMQQEPQLQLYAGLVVKIRLCSRSQVTGKAYYFLSKLDGRSLGFSWAEEFLEPYPQQMIKDF